MSNRLSMSKIHSIETLHQSGHSNREIARLLSVDRGTVNAYVRRLKSQNRPDPQTGSTVESVEGPSRSEIGPDQNRPNPQTGSSAPVVNQPEFPPVRSGPRSLCDGYREQIEQKLEAGLSVQRILQDLKGDGFKGSYHSVRRFIVSLGKKTPLPFRRMETGPGEEAQIDFGMAAPVVMADGKKRRPWLFRVVLSCSRKAYSEVVWHQTSDNFVAAIENSFHYFGGVPKTLVIDNLKAAVNRADWYDPDVHPKLQSFAAHYGTVFVPTKPYKSVLPFLKDRLLTVTPMQFEHVRDLLKDDKAELVGDYWKTARTDETPELRFQAACALASFDPNNDKWQGEDFRTFIAGHRCEDGSQSASIAH